MQATVRAPNTLEDRLEAGAQLLFDCEQRGDTGADYARWLSHWLQLLSQYENRPA